MEIKLHRFVKSDGSIDFEAAFDGKAYTNATEEYQKFGKSHQSFGYFKDATLVPYAQKLIDLGKITMQENLASTDNELVTVDDLIIVRKGGNPHEQGTWLHPKLAIVFARWLDLEFAIWCDEKISELLANGVVALLPEDQKWVDLVEGLVDGKPGNAWFMSQVEEILTCHEQQGYNIKAFDDLMQVLRDITPKDDQPKVFKKTRKLIKDLYEKGILSRTSHETMLERCTETVIEVLEKQVKRERRLRNKFELKGAAPVIETESTTPAAPSIAQLAVIAKRENDDALKASYAIIDAQFIDGHKLLGLSPKPSDLPIRTHLFGNVQPVRDCITAMKAEGLHVAFGATLYPKAYNAKEGSPDLKYTEPYTKIGVAVWFNADGSASCKIQKTIQKVDQNIYKLIAELRLTSLTSIDPAFWTGSNKENTIRVTLSTTTNFLMVYGYSADQKL